MTRAVGACPGRKPVGTAARTLVVGLPKDCGVLTALSVVMHPTDDNSVSDVESHHQVAAGLTGAVVPVDLL